VPLHHPHLTGGGFDLGRPPVIPPEKKARIVSAVLSGEASIAEAARKERVSEQSVRRWKAEFIEAGKDALTARGCFAVRCVQLGLPRIRIGRRAR